MTTEATFAGTLPAIQRTQDHRYIYQGVTYPGVTNVLRVLDKSGALMTWAARETAEAMLAMHDDPGLDQMINMVGRDGLTKAATSRANWKRDEAAQLGTAIHTWADEYVSLGILPAVSDTARAYTEHYAEWWRGSGWRLRLSEACVVSKSTRRDGDPFGHSGWGGTFDLLCYDREGRTVLADIKTGKGVYKEAILQLTAYGMSEYVSPMGSSVVYPMVVPDRYCILHVTRDGVREVELSIGELEWKAWRACLDLYEWNETAKGKL